MINSRNKGNTFERKVCKQLTEAFGVEFIRTPHSGAFATIHKKVESIQEMQSDITYDHSKFRWFGVIECKHYNTIRVYPDLWNPKSDIRKWIAKLEAEVPDEDWLLIFQQNRSEAMALCPQNIDNIFWTAMGKEHPMYAIVDAVPYIVLPLADLIASTVKQNGDLGPLGASSTMGQNETKI